MHWARWGDPAHVSPLPDDLRNLLIGVLGVSGEPDLAVDIADVRLPDRELPAQLTVALEVAVGADNVRSDHEGGFEGTQERTEATRAGVTTLLNDLGGTVVGEDQGNSWAEGRFHGSYLRDSLLETGVLVETLETATFWSNMSNVFNAVRAALTDALTGQGTQQIVQRLDPAGILNPGVLVP